MLNCALFVMFISYLHHRDPVICKQNIWSNKIVYVWWRKWATELVAKDRRHSFVTERFIKAFIKPLVGFFDYLLMMICKQYVYLVLTYENQIYIIAISVMLTNPILIPKLYRSLEYTWGEKSSVIDRAPLATIEMGCYGERLHCSDYMVQRFLR